MQELQELATGLFMAVMSFLGWSYDEYKQALPQVVEKTAQTIEEVATKLPSSTPTTPTKPATPLEIKETSKPKPLPIPSTPEPSKPKPIENTVPTPTSLPVSTEQKIQASVANLLCTTIKGNKIEKRTGSAVAISNNGVLLTNAHVAQHLLLANTSESLGQTCFVRTGSPAQSAYKAKVVYMPTSWIYANKDNLKYQSISGTGENDFALIVLTEKTAKSSNDLSFLKPKKINFDIGQSIFLSGYPAFNGSILDRALYNVTEKNNIKNTWSINNSQTALADSGPSVVAFEGSSGGAVTDTEGNLIGIIVATTVDSNKRQSIRFISYDYIADAIQSQTNKSIDEFIKNADTLSGQFLSSEGLRLANILRSNSN